MADFTEIYLCEFIAPMKKTTKAEKLILVAMETTTSYFDPLESLDFALFCARGTSRIYIVF